ncbi:MAG: hypothetical protein Q4D61_02845 [Cardiobacteriaceae bacterium]|nr:hypothetical protein [Cardiobacteriaceae bacterium]
MKHTLIAALIASGIALAQAQTPQQYTVGSGQGLQNLPANTPVMPAHAAKKRRNIPVKHLDLSSGSARVSGSVRGLGVAVYRFHGQAGQTIRISRNQSTRQIDAAVFHPGDGQRFADGQVLPQSGEYELRIVNIRKDAARNKKPRSYNITFSLQGGGNPATDTPVQTGPADIHSRHGHVTGGPTHYRYAHPHGNMRQSHAAPAIQHMQSGHQHYGGVGYNAQGVPSAAEAGVRPIRLNGQ